MTASRAWLVLPLLLLAGCASTGPGSAAGRIEAEVLPSPDQPPAVVTARFAGRVAVATQWSETPDLRLRRLTIAAPGWRRTFVAPAVVGLDLSRAEIHAGRRGRRVTSVDLSAPVTVSDEGRVYPARLTILASSGAGRDLIQLDAE